MKMMKLNTLFLLFSGFFTSCNPAPDATTTAANKAVSVMHKTEEKVSLPKDAKWQADANTNKNVNLLQQKAAELNKDEMTAPSHYHNIASSLQTGIDQLVKECKMKGPDHDALHLWLEPLMGEIKELKTVATTDTGDRLFYSIRTRLLDYNLYFD
jgi:hypothetical protein